MNLTKLLRKHSRTLLMVFMALLLVAFLIPQQIQGCGENARMRAILRGEAYGEEISDIAVGRADREMRVLAAFGIRPPIMSNDPLDYYLLMREAEAMGLQVGREEVIDRLRAIGMTDEAMESRQQYLRMSYDDIYDTIGHWMAVDRLMTLQASAVATSLPRLKKNFRDAAQEVVADISAVYTRAFLPLVPEPTPEELDAFFAECKDRDTAHTTDELVFGYRLPDRVQIEYLTVDPTQIESVVRVSGKEAREHFHDYASRYTKPDPNAIPTGQSPPPRIPMTYDEAQEQVRENVRKLQAVEEAQSLVNEIRSAAYRPWIAPATEEGFTPIPEVELPSFKSLQERFSTKYDVMYGTTPLGSLDDLRTIPGLGRASLGDGATRIAAPELAFRVKGLIDEAPDDNRPVLNLMEPSPVMLTRQRDPVTGQQAPYQAYLFRVVRIAPSAPPTSREEVGPKLVEDWKLVQAHKLAREWADKLAERARANGLATAAESFSELEQILEAGETLDQQPNAPEYVEALQPQRPSRLTRNTGFDPKLGTITGVAQDMLALSDRDADHPVAVIPRASEFRFLVAELVEVKPIYQATFDQQLAQAARRGTQTEQTIFGMGWADPENVQARTGFIAASRPEPEPAPEP